MQLFLVLEVSFCPTCGFRP
ncbi:hypothetical protein D043_0787A, partial [Vibrio parahaemolyticus EKP-021]